jgi:hypothetical protein
LAIELELRELFIDPLSLRMSRAVVESAAATADEGWWDEPSEVDAVDRESWRLFIEDEHDADRVVFARGWWSGWRLARALVGDVAPVIDLIDAFSDAAEDSEIELGFLHSPVEVADVAVGLMHAGAGIDLSSVQEAFDGDSDRAYFDVTDRMVVRAAGRFELGDEEVLSKAVVALDTAALLVILRWAIHVGQIDAGVLCALAEDVRTDPT